MGAHGGNNERNSPSTPGAPLGSDNVIESNYFIDNGGAAIIGAGSKRVVIRGNVFLRNNQLRFHGKKRYEHAAIKCHDARDGVIEGNYVADHPLSDGIWLDNQFPGTRVTRNVVVNNGGRGIFLEMSDYKYDAAHVDHNVAVGNHAIQFYVHDASGSTVTHNLFANSPTDAKYGQGAYIYQVTKRTRTGYHSLYNNVFVNHKVMLDINYPAHRSGPQRLDHNVYDAAAGERSFLVNSASDKPSPWEPQEFLELVRRDVGSLEPEFLQSGGKVALKPHGMACVLGTPRPSQRPKQRRPERPECQLRPKDSGACSSASLRPLERRKYAEGGDRPRLLRSARSAERYGYPGTIPVFSTRRKSSHRLERAASVSHRRVAVSTSTHAPDFSGNFAGPQRKLFP